MEATNLEELINEPHFNIEKAVFKDQNINVIVGFTSYNEVEEFADTHNLELVKISRKNGERLYKYLGAVYNKKEMDMTRVLENNPDVEVFDFESTEKDVVDYFNRQIESLESIEEIKFKLNISELLLEALNEIEEDEIITLEDSYITIKERYATSYEDDVTSYVLGVTNEKVGC